MPHFTKRQQNLGGTYIGEDCSEFRVWAPYVQKVEVHLFTARDRLALMEKRERGYFQALVEGVKPGTLYLYRLDGMKERPDPASRFQPQGVHGPSQVTDCDFTWSDQDWRGLPLKNYIIYEIHVGTFTPEGTFEATIPHLEELKEVGITAVELMPVAQFPGNRNWGYDGVFPFAVQNSYGGPEGLKKLVNACHLKGLSVILDVVYNHLGPEGNYLMDFGPYFTDRYKTFWGSAISFDGAHSDEVRHFFMENALYWIEKFHIDALRLDALHAIFDFSAKPFLRELATLVHDAKERINRRVYLIAESDRNDASLVQPQDMGGYGLDAHWNDDFHHALHTLLTGERAGYYQDFGRLQDLAKAFREGFIYSGEYSLYRRRRHGNSSGSIPAHRFVVFAQNHDQVGNRMFGERLSQLVSLESLKLAAGVVLLSPFIPLLFMGEEYGETAPFLYFVSHLDPALVEAVRRGRQEEFSSFSWLGQPPDPQEEKTFLNSNLYLNLRHQGEHRMLWEFYRELIKLRKILPPLAFLSKEHTEVHAFEKERLLFVRRWKEEQQVFMAFSFNNTQVSVTLPLPLGMWSKQFDSADEKWLGEGSSIPEQLQSAGEVKLSLNPMAFTLFTLL